MKAVQNRRAPLVWFGNFSLALTYEAVLLNNSIPTLKAFHIGMWSCALKVLQLNVPFLLPCAGRPVLFFVFYRALKNRSLFRGEFIAIGHCDKRTRSKLWFSSIFAVR